MDEVDWTAYAADEVERVAKAKANLDAIGLELSGDPHCIAHSTAYMFAKFTSPTVAAEFKKRYPGWDVEVVDADENTKPAQND